MMARTNTISCVASHGLDILPQKSETQRTDNWFMLPPLFFSFSPSFSLSPSFSFSKNTLCISNLHLHCRIST